MDSLRFLTATSLFDGHDVSINIIRRLLQSKGVEVIHLGHNRSAREVVDAALQEDVHAIALSSYQGGHNEYFSYIRELLDKNGANNVKIFGGGGGVIIPSEINQLHKKGITKIYSPEDGLNLGLQGIIDDMIKKAKGDILGNYKLGKINSTLSNKELGKLITYIEEKGKIPFDYKEHSVPVLGITGTGGAGKSSLIDELLYRFANHIPNIKIALISIDPTKKNNKGALLGDRIRISSATYENFFIRSLATRFSKTELTSEIRKVVSFLKSQDFDLIIVETSGIGQSSNEIIYVADKCIYVMTPEYGAQTQLEKIEMLESADFIVINKFDKRSSEDALRDVRKQYRRNKVLFKNHNGAPSDNELPIFGTITSRFNDEGTNDLFLELIKSFNFNLESKFKIKRNRFSSNIHSIIPIENQNYLRLVAKTCRDYNKKVLDTIEKLKDYESLIRTDKLLKEPKIKKRLKYLKENIGTEVFEQINQYKKNVEMYQKGKYTYLSRGNKREVNTKYITLSQLEVPRVAYLKDTYLSKIYRFITMENLPGFFPFSAGIFPFKRVDESSKRMFAGEGGPSRTNKRFHLLSEDEDAKRLSVAFDSVTLYGEDPDKRPDIFGKIGEAGVSIATIDDMSTLFKGFNLADPKTSVSMTINGPAPIILAMYLNAAIKQHLSGEDFWNNKKRIEIMRQLRGTVQADILKEDQAQNTCIFSLEFSLKLMGDMQEYFCKNSIKNYYTVSISGYHIAEAGANPITQAAFTLANGFTYIEYYLSRGMHIDDFSENLSFFFSNGLDPEYAVIGNVARKIWAVVLKNKYNANEKSQKFKYHIQTSGRSLHAQEISFNDIRTTLQAFLAISDNCNSLHTNAYDEAITTPTEESVRRAIAIQLIISKEFGLNKTDNPLQGSYLIEELSSLVEEAILREFERISDRGGVMGSMETMYQRGKIQEESLYYETLKDSGELPIVGVNMYKSKIEENNLNIELSRCSDEEKINQIKHLEKFKKSSKNKSIQALERLKKVGIEGENIFEELLYTVNFCSLGEITNLLFEIGGKYRRNM